MFFFYILIIILVITVMIVSTTIEVHIEKLNFSAPKKQERYINPNYKIKINVYTLKKIKLLESNINKEKLEEPKMKKNINKLQENIDKNRNKLNIKQIQYLKNLNIKLKQLNLQIDIGLEDASKTAITVGLISNIVSIILKMMCQENSKNKWKVTPIYKNRNLSKIELDCIFCIKMIHIIDTIYVIKKEGEKQNGRASNRRYYAYNNE